VPRSLAIFVAVLAVAAIVYWPAGWLFSPLVYWGIAVAAALALAVWGSKPAPPGGYSEFICDRCRYNNERDCAHPERPNATRCPDYRAR